MKIFNKKNILIYNRAYSRLNIIIAITVFLSMIAIIVCLLKEATSWQINDYQRSHSPSYKLQNGLKFMRDEIEKASYPIKVENRNIIFTNPSSLPFLFALRLFENTYNEIYFKNYNFFYKAGVGDSGELVAPSSNEIIKFISFKVCAPINSNNNFQYIEQTKITTVSFYWKGITDKNPHPSILYQRISLPADVNDKTGPIEFISNVNKIFLKTENFNDNDNKHSNRSIIVITIETIFDNYNTKSKFIDNIKALCNVRPDSSL